MEATVIIRAYELRDRAAVRTICCETADRGGPVEGFFRDRELVADLVTRYYTDFDPAACAVAELDGAVVGYVTGCVDESRVSQLLMWRIAVAAFLRAVGRGVLAQRQTWRMVGALWRTWRRGGAKRGEPMLRYPAHVHVNVLAHCRGQEIGPKLLERFLEQCRAAGVSGVTAGVRGDNDGGRRFFERMGFVALARYPLVLPEETGFMATETIVYGRKLETVASERGRAVPDRIFAPGC